jgi:excisionase family DNA binding protein
MLPDDEMLSTQAAAERLNVSRQYVMRLVDQGVLPSTRAGDDWHLQSSDVVAYKVQRDARRDAALDQLTALSEDMDGYLRE